MNERLAIVLATLFFFCFCSGSSIGVLRAQDSKQEEHRQAIQEEDKLTPDKTTTSAVSDEVRNQIVEFFDELQIAFSSEQGSSIPQQFSVDALVKSAEERGVLEPVEGAERERLIQGVRKGIARSAEQWKYMEWDTHDIRKIDRLTTDKFAVVIRHWYEEEQTYSIVRWWLVQDSSSTFKIYDFESFDHNLRISSLLAAGWVAAKNKAPWVKPFIRLFAVIQQDSIEALVSNLNEHQTDIDTILAGNPPAEIRGFTLMLLALHHMSAETQESNQKALETAERIVRSRNYPIGHYLKGLALMNLEQYAEAIDSFEDYSRLLGWDSDTYELVSDCYLVLENDTKAIEFAELGLKDNPRATGCLASLALALPSERRAELRPHFKKLDYDEGALEHVIDWAIECEEYGLARYLLVWLKEAHPKSDLIGVLQRNPGKVDFCF